jgi:hypothetical protein
VARLNAAIPWLYAVLALAFGIVLAWTTPPFQMADETTHFARADALTFGPAAFAPRDSDGRLHIAARAHQAVLDAALRAERVKFHPAEKVRAADLDPSAGRLDGRMGVFFPGQAFNPLLYLPPSAAVAWGRHFGWTVLDTLQLARVLNLMATVGLGAAAVALAGGARLSIFAILMLPMSMALAASVSQDGPVLGLAALAVALVSRAMAADRPLSRGECLLAALAVALAAMAKAPYAVLAVLLLLAPAQDRRTAGIAAGFALVVGIGSNLWQAASGWAAPPPPGMSSDFLGQARFLGAHLDRIPGIVAATFARHGPHYLPEIVGVLGWLDTPLPNAFYPAAYAMLGAAVAAPAAVGLGGGWRRVRIGAPLLALAGIAGVFLALYLGWSRTGSPVIEGVQGRYLLPLLLMLPLMLEGPRPLLGGDPVRTGLRAILTAGVLAFPLVSLAVTVETLIRRYYLA